MKNKTGSLFDQADRIAASKLWEQFQQASEGVNMTLDDVKPLTDFETYGLHYLAYPDHQWGIISLFWLS